MRAWLLYAPRSVRACAIHLALALTTGALAACRTPEAPPAPRAHPREERPADDTSGALGAVTGDEPSAAAVRRAQAAVRAHPREAARLVALARAWVERARDTEDPGLYRQADDAVRRALDLDPRNVDAGVERALLLLQDHRFREARDAATALLAGALDRATARAETLGILSDATLELGDYPAAVEAAQAMVDARPGGASYARAAWLRYMHNDLPGARELMLRAMDAAPRAHEAGAWIVTQNGVLAFAAGDLDAALRYFNQALAAVPSFSAAHAGRARVLLARGDFPGAMASAEAAVRSFPTAEHEWLAGDCAAAAGRAAEAAAHYAALERVGARTDPRVLALYYATVNREPAQAVALARRERESRQDVWTDDALAFALYRAGDLPGAREAMARARRIETPDARMLYHAGLIARAAGDRDAAVRALQGALAVNAYWDRAEADAARHTLRELGAPTAVTAPTGDAAR